MSIDLDFDITDYHDVVGLFHGESDRGAAILAGSSVENFLGIYLHSIMANKEVGRKLFDANGPLSSFSQRISCAYAFGYIAKHHYEDLNCIRKIRNYFAHHPRSAAFDQSPVADWANSLGAAKAITALNRDKKNCNAIFLFDINIHVYIRSTQQHAREKWRRGCWRKIAGRAEPRSVSAACGVHV